MNNTRYTVGNVKVRVIDTEKLSQVLSDQIGDSKKTYKVYPSLGIVTTPSIALITNECVGTTKQPFNIELYAEWLNEDGREVFEGAPSMVAHMTIGDFADFIKEETTLKDFMGDRYQYNSRIQNNERIWMDIFNGKDK